MTLLLQATARKSPEERNVSLSAWILNEWVNGKGGGGGAGGVGEFKSSDPQRLTLFTLALFNESQASAQRWITAVCWCCDPLSEVFSLHPFPTESSPNKKHVSALLSSSAYDLSLAGSNPAP